MDNNDNDFNADNTGFDSNDNSDPGAQSDNSNSSSDNSGNQNGQSPAQVDQEKIQMQKQIRALNKQLIQARRGGQNPSQDPNAQNDPNDVAMQQYGTALQIATGKLREGIEDVFGYYPEVDQKVINQIRKNPWAFSSQESYINGDFDFAKLEIEEYLLELAEAGGQPNPNPTPSPANINPNPVQEPKGNQAPGTDEDEDPMTMPMSKLEKLAKQAAGKMKAQNA